MDSELKAKWVAALRSGEYRQGKKYLSVDGPPRMYCCLGVLQDLTGCKADPNGDELLEDGMYGLSHRKQGYLADLNDGNVSCGIEPHTFPQIADYIEEEL